jgi:putative acetyltransferase
MNASANPKLSMRPFLLTDTPVAVDIFRASIEELAAEDYSDTQREAWTSGADDEEAFGARLAGQLTLLGSLGRSVVGFASLKGSDELDMLYVHPAATGQGIGTMLMEALERLASARGAALLKADVSDTALAFFKGRGFVAQQRNSVPIASEWLANTTMTKKLSKERPS